jgi:thioredoxin 1
MKTPAVPVARFSALACLALFASGLRASDSKPAIPRLVDLGAGKCIPCKMMKPILDELTQEYAGQFDVVFIDVWENREAGAKYGIRLIPTQIFYSAEDQELFRHEGFLAKKDILAKWKELGIALKEPASPKDH